MTPWNARGCGELGCLDIELDRGQVILLSSSDGLLASRALRAIADESERRRRRAQGIEGEPGAHESARLLRAESRLPLCTSWFAGDAAEPTLQSLARLTGICEEILPEGVSEWSHPCPSCSGLGLAMELAEERLVDESKTLRDGALHYWHRLNAAYYQGVLEELCKRHGIDMNVAWSALGPAARHLLMQGEREEGGFVGVVADMHTRVERALERGEDMGDWRDFVCYQPCGACAGSALDEEARSARLGGLRIIECFDMSLAELLAQRRHTDLAKERLELACAFGLAAHRLGASVPALGPKERATGRLVPLVSAGLIESCVLLDAPAGVVEGNAARALSARLHWMSERGTTLLLAQSGDSELEGLEPSVRVCL